jgi:hypothetical protein
VNTAHGQIEVGVVVERHKAASQWVDYVWRPISVLAGVPVAEPWTELASTSETTTYYAGAAVIELHKSETTNYRANLATGLPGLWVVLRPTGAEPPYKVFTVTADPAEGEAMTEAGNDLVEQVPMPEAICAVLQAFIAEHHVEREFYKRPQTPVDPEALARRLPHGNKK